MMTERHDAEWKERPSVADHPPEPIASIERRIRARERDVVRWLHEAPWRGGHGLAATIATARRVHSDSIARERMSE